MSSSAALACRSSRRWHRPRPAVLRCVPSLSSASDRWLVVLAGARPEPFPADTSDTSCDVAVRRERGPSVQASRVRPGQNCVKVPDLDICPILLKSAKTTVTDSGQRWPAVLHAHRVLRLERGAQETIQIPKHVISEEECVRSTRQHILSKGPGFRAQRFVLFEIAENTQIGRTAVLSKFCNLSCDGLRRCMGCSRLRNLNVSRHSRSFVDVDNVDGSQTSHREGRLLAI